MTVIADVQTLEPGAKVQLYEIDGTLIGAPTLRFHSMRRTTSVWWQGVEYAPWPLEAEGFARTSSGSPNPKLTVGNIGGLITGLCMSYGDMVGAKFIRHQTFAKYLDAVNFGGVNPTADPTQELPKEIWFVERKVTETRQQVVFELASAMDFNGMQLPGRMIMASKCGWLVKGGYRSSYCGYAGGPVAKYDGTPTAVLGEDRCGGRVSDCELRFGVGNPLPYGGFVAAGLLR